MNVQDGQYATLGWRPGAALAVHYPSRSLPTMPCVLSTAILMASTQDSAAEVLSWLEICCTSCNLFRRAIQKGGL